jgi:hypothetical protein
MQAGQLHSTVAHGGYLAQGAEEIALGERANRVELEGNL